MSHISIHNKNKVIAFYISYIKNNNINFDKDLLLIIIDYFRYVNIYDLHFNNIDILYNYKNSNYFNFNNSQINKINCDCVKKINLNADAIQYDNSFIFTNDDYLYQKDFNWNIDINNVDSYKFKDLIITVIFKFNKKIIKSITFNYSDTLNNNKHFKFIFPNSNDMIIFLIQKHKYLNINLKNFYSSNEYKTLLLKPHYFIIPYIIKLF